MTQAEDAGNIKRAEFEKVLGAAATDVASFDEEKPSLVKRLQRFLHAYPTIVPFIVLVFGILLGASVNWTRFATGSNLSTILLQVTIIGILGIAQTLIILTAGIDLSVGIVMVLSSIVMGRLGDAYLFASETCAFDAVGGEAVRDLLPGELLVLDREGLHEGRFAEGQKRAICAMEYIYFARPDSDIDAINIHSARKRMGKQLAMEAFVDADVVTGVPDSSISAAIGPSKRTMRSFHRMPRRSIRPL